MRKGTLHPHIQEMNVWMPRGAVSPIPCAAARGGQGSPPLSSHRYPDVTVMGVPGILALFSSQRKNPVLVNVLIVASIISCIAILVVIVYSSFTLNYGEEEELSSAPVHVIHTKFILNKVVKGANVAMLAASICSAFAVLAMAYLGCRSLPRCSCYDSVTGMEWLQPSEDQNQAVEMVCAVQSPGGRIFNFPDRFPAQDLDAEEDASKPPPYVRMA
ncbi:PREDICTED: uncharacterized protein LOC104514205 [Eurypyga helias]|uniref:uncharacterized protein LOC104514205 n=1 Tax=Eurypyga helias TaxID=54383 RepID=UPI0005291789|nr:PREDICTED: uncharacterized protein LOC104514205 [Eurypyga helias]